MDLIEKLDNYICEAKKITRATVKSILKQTKADQFDGLEWQGDTIGLWYDHDTEKEATKLMKAIVKKLPDSSTTNDGNKYLIYWKGGAPDISRINTR